MPRVKTLREVGIAAAFGDGAAAFSRVDGTRNLYISEVAHKAFVAVVEAGTQAAAATAVIVAEMAAPETAVELTVDHPFAFLIRDLQSGALLFVGRVVDLRVHPST